MDTNLAEIYHHPEGSIRNAITLPLLGSYIFSRVQTPAVLLLVSGIWAHMGATAHQKAYPGTSRLLARGIQLDMKD